MIQRYNSTTWANTYPEKSSCVRCKAVLLESGLTCAPHLCEACRNALNTLTAVRVTVPDDKVECEQ